jgi:hypothetical protein
MAKKMTLKETIRLHDELAPNETMLASLILTYDKSIHNHYRKKFGCEPVLMVAKNSSLTGAYVKLIPENQFFEKITEYVNTLEGYPDDVLEDIKLDIIINSTFLRNFIKY